MEVARDAILSWINAYFPNSPAPSFESLSDGHHFYKLLNAAAPYCFTEDDEISLPRTDNRIMKRNNLMVLLRDMSLYGTTYLKSTDGFDLVAASATAGGGGGAPRINIESISNGFSAGGGAEGSVEALQELAEYVAAMAALAANSGLIEKLKLLPKDKQMALNGMIKRIMTLHGFKKAVPPNRGQQATTPPPPNLGGANSNNNNNNNGGGGVSSAAVPSSSYSNNNKGMGELRSNDDPSVLRGELNVLRNDLRDKAAALDTAESKCSVAEQQLEQLQARYRILLEQSESRGATTKERELQQALAAAAKREEQISQLSAMLSDMEIKNRELIALRRKTEDDHEKVVVQLEAEKKRSKELIASKSDVVNQLSLVEDMLTLAKNKNETFEKELLKRENEEAARRATAAQNQNNNNVNRSDADSGMANSDELRQLVSDLKAKLSASENKVAILERMGGGGAADAQQCLVFNTSTHADDDNVSNGSITVRGDTNALKDSLAGSPAAPLAASSNAAVVAANATISALTAEIALLKSQLADSTNLIRAAEDKLKEEVEASRSRVETMQIRMQQAADEAAVRGATEKLQSDVEELQREKEQLRKALQEERDSMQQQEDKWRSSAAAKVDEVQQRLAEGRKAMLAEQAVVTSVVFHCGQRSLALQQRNLLGGAAVPHVFRDEAFSALFRRQDAYEKEMVGGGANGDGSSSESFMSKARIAGLWGSMRSAGGSSSVAPAQQGGRR